MTKEKHEGALDIDGNFSHSISRRILIADIASFAIDTWSNLSKFSSSLPRSSGLDWG